MGSFLRYLVTVGILSLAAGCTPSQQVTVTESATAPAVSTGPESVAVVRSQNADAPPEAYSAQLESKLAAAGYRVVPRASATLFVTLDYGVGEPRTDVVEIEIPEYRTEERFERLNGQLVTFYEDVFYGYRTETHRETVYPAFIEVRIHRAVSGGGAPEAVYQGRVRTEGRCGDMDHLIGPLLDALFDDPSRRGDRVHEHRVKVEGC